MGISAYPAFRQTHVRNNNCTASWGWLAGTVRFTLTKITIVGEMLWAKNFASPGRPKFQADAEDKVPLALLLSSNHSNIHSLVEWESPVYNLVMIK